MKKITLISLFLILAFNYLLAQSPQTFKYQAVARDAGGVVLTDQAVSFRISILEGSSGGTSVYSETHPATTNQFGLVNLEIGNGLIVSGVFEDINWGSNLFFLQIEMDATGGTNYQLMGTSQLLSVPYALNASSLTLRSPNGETYDVMADKYGNMVMMPSNFDCGSEFYDIRDGQVYNTVKILNQCWMKDNLNYDIGNSWCYSDDPVKCLQYGRLYDWETIMNGSSGSFSVPSGITGICPEGWHVPSDGEWCNLTQFADNEVDCNANGLSGANVGIILKSQNGFNGINALGFSVLPGGARNDIGSFIFSETKAFFWTSSVTDFGIYRAFHDYSGQIERGFIEKEFGYSLRCVKDYTNQDPDQPINPVPSNGAIDLGVNNVELSWTCNDPDGHNLIYDIYFGISSDPPIIEKGLQENSYNLGILEPETTYYWKVIASDGLGGNSESSIWSFTTMTGFNCGELLIDPRDSHDYSTVQIGTQCWMAQNIDYVVGNSLCYDNLLDNCLTYGRLYSAGEAQLACPPGWHLPDDSEWCILAQFIDATVNCTTSGSVGTDAGIKMKSTSGWLYNGNGTDDFSFNALPAGSTDNNGNFYSLEGGTHFWTSTGGSELDNWAWVLGSTFNNIERNAYLSANGYSVRCLKD